MSSFTEKNIEYFANNHKLVISIDQSTSFKEIIKNGSRLIYYNHLNQRHSVNPRNLIYKNKKFKMISELSELKKELKKYSEEIINNKLLILLPKLEMHKSSMKD